MKSFIILLGIALSVVSCSTQTYLEPTVLASVVENRTFKFNASKAYPTNNDVQNVLNSMSAGSSGRLMNLDPGYGFALDKNLFEAYLPYFGRAYRVQTNPDSAGIKFSSKDFSVKSSKTKKGNDLLVITTKDLQENFTFNVEIYKNGSAFVAIQSVDRQPISFDGSISKLEKKN